MRMIKSSLRLACVACGSAYGRLDDLYRRFYSESTVHLGLPVCARQMELVLAASSFAHV